MPVIVLLVIIAVVAVCAAAFFGYRAYKHRTLAEKLDKRDDDQVHYAFIVNPSKPQAEQRKQHIKEFCEAKHLTQIEFIETQLDKDGRACAFEALDHGADVVVAVGGDGTVRTVASALSGTGHALGIVPIGTGNLFARNMGIPVDDIDAALTVATSHGSRLVDVGRLTLLDDETTDHGHAFLIIAGIGFDALMIDDTDPELKKNISWLAYFVSGVKNLFAPKYKGNVTITSAEGSTHSTRGLTFRTFMAGNCGQIPMFSLMPEASYDDGILDYEIIDTSGGLIGWANLSATCCTRPSPAKLSRVRCPRTPPSTRCRASARKSLWRGLFWRRWMAICCLKRSTSVSAWNVRPYACACRRPLPKIPAYWR